ncbi:hypothetical protein ADL26_07360, partial [Thermoactinomyces vulgaris]
GPNRPDRRSRAAAHPRHRTRDVRPVPSIRLAALAVVGGEVGEVASPAHDRLGVAGLAGLLDDPVQVVADAAEAGEVVVGELLGLFGGDAELLAEPVRREAVGEAVRHGLDLAAVLGGDVLGRHGEDLRGDGVVDVLAGDERVDQALVAGEAGHDAHLDLAVVDGHERLEALGDHEP